MKCDYCDDESVVEVNNHRACAAHVDQAMGAALAPMKQIRELLEKGGRSDAGDQ